MCNVFSDVFGQHWLDNIPMQCWSSMVDITLYRLSLHKRCTLAIGQHFTGNCLIQYWPRQKQPPEEFCKKTCYLKFHKIDWKHLYQSLFFAEACNFIKEALAQVFSGEFAIFLRTPVLQSTSGRLLLPRQIQTKLEIIFLWKVV